MCARHRCVYLTNLAPNGCHSVHVFVVVFMYKVLAAVRVLQGTLG